MKKELEKLSIEEKIGQMMMIGMDTPHIMDEIDDLILKYKIGGVLLYRENYQNQEELIECINYIKKLNSVNKIPIWIGTDFEGGRVNRLPLDFEKVPSAHKLAKASKEEDFVKQMANITSKMLHGVGFNLNFAPVLDIKRFEDNHAIGDRAYSEKKEEVAHYGIEVMKELKKNSILSVIKHFPGHGATNKDSHFKLSTIKQTMEQLEKEDILPFKEAIQEGADAILVSHLLIKGATQKYPATMSRKFVTKYLRKKYRYRGLLITDDMKMKGVQLFYGKKKPIKKAIKAGYDMILFKFGNDQKLLKEIIEETKNDPKKEARINRAVNRILTMKETYEITDEEITIEKDFQEKTNQKIQEIKRKIEGGE